MAGILDQIFSTLSKQAPAPSYAIRSGGTQNNPIGGVGGVLPYVWGEAIYIDTAAPGGTEPPNGTRAHPCATLAQARIVAAARGINTYHLLSDVAINADITGATFRSDYGRQPTFTVDLAAFSVDTCIFHDLQVTGIAHLASIDQIYCYDCVLAWTTNPINIVAWRCWLWAGVKFCEDVCYMFDCYSVGNVTLDFNAATAACLGDIVNFNSNAVLTIDNLNAAGDVRISGSSMVTITAACNAGDIWITGNIAITNGGTSTLHDTSLPTFVARTRISHSAQWGLCTEEIQLTDAATDTAFPQIVISKIPAGAVVTCAYLGIKYGAIENTAVGVNKVNGAQHIQINRGGAGWVDAIHIPDDYLTLAGATREGGDIIWGDIDLAATVTGNATYTIQWDECLVDADFMLLNNVQTVLYIEYSI